MKNKQVTLYGNYIKNKRIAFIIDDRKEAYNAPDYIIELRKYGCDVFPYVLSKKVKYVNKSVLIWASNHKVNNELCDITCFDTLVRYTGKGGLKYE